MKGLPPHLNQQLRQTLSRCGPFDSNEALQRVFVDARIRPWAGLVAETDARQDRIDNLIALLYEQTASQTQENALALFLLVLSERRQSGDACRQELAALARQVASHVGSRVETGDEQPLTPQTAPQKNILNNRGVIIEGPVTDSAITVGTEPGQRNLLWLILVVVVIISIGVAFLIWLDEPETNGFTGNVATLAATPRPTSSPPIPTRLPQPVVFPALAEQKLRDIAAANGHIWFATEQGLFHYDTVTDGQPEQVAAARVEVVAAAPGGSEVWLSASEADGSRIGRYRPGEASVTWLPQSAWSGWPTAMQIDAQGNLWVGDDAGRLFQLRPGTDQLQPLPPPLPESSLTKISDLALSPGQIQTIWLVAGRFLYRWQADDWVDILDRNMITSSVINAAIVDSQERVWFGHAAGVTVYKTSPSSDLRQECPIADLDSQVVTDVAIGNGGADLWVITQSGLARLDVAVETFNINDCASWVWQTFREDSFWQPDPLSTQYRLAVDETPNGQTAAIWLIRRDTGKIRRLFWSSQ